MAVRCASEGKHGKYVGTVKLSSSRTAVLDVPVVALVRRVRDVVSTFEGTNSASGKLQVESEIGAEGKGQTHVHVPKGFYVVHGLMSVAPGSGIVLSPSIDIGADGEVEWAYSGTLDLGVRLENVEGAINAYLAAHQSNTNGVMVPICVTASSGEGMVFGGLQLYLDSVPKQLDSPNILPNGSIEFELRGQPGFTYRIERSFDLIAWTSLTKLVLTNGAAVITDPTTLGSRHMFYRAALD